MTKKLTLHNDVQQISKLADFVDTIAEEASIDPSLAMSLNLALEEAVTNVVMYAYPAGEEGDVDIVAELSDGSLLFTISDKGIPFDPTKKEDADITLGVEERQIGGLGIFLVRQLMDTVEYERKDGYNILTMKKKL
jgi:anti-sigma regulatory factor (Ser/Thr protein kinase)